MKSKIKNYFVKNTKNKKQKKRMLKYSVFSPNFFLTSSPNHINIMPPYT
jgi:hypothetical protein